MADRPRTRVSLVPDCGSCFGLCCVALPFAASADFPVDKPAGQPCGNLRSDFRLRHPRPPARDRLEGLHRLRLLRRRPAGLAGDVRRGVLARRARDGQPRCTPCCRSCGSCTRCCPTSGRRSRSPGDATRAELTALLDEVEELTRAPRTALLAVDLVALRDARAARCCSRRAPSSRADARRVAACTGVTAPARASRSRPARGRPARRGPPGGRPAGRLPHRRRPARRRPQDGRPAGGRPARRRPARRRPHRRALPHPAASSPRPEGTRGRASRGRCDGRTTGPDGAPARGLGPGRPFRGSAGDRYVEAAQQRDDARLDVVRMRRTASTPDRRGRPGPSLRSACPGRRGRCRRAPS